MPQLTSQPEAPIPALTPQQEAAATDHLAHLPKMSPTAGVATQEYVAINVGAVFALLLGFASILALMQNALILIPIAAIVVAVVSLRQIADSNGTQTGRGIATAGLFMAAGITSFVVSSAAFEYLGSRADKAAISTLCEKFGDDLRTGQYDAGYDLFSQRFKSRVSRGDFVTTMKIMQLELHTASQDGNDFTVVGGKWNGLAAFYTDPDSGVVTAQTVIQLFYKQAASHDSLDATFRKETITGNSGASEEIWTIDDIPKLFPAKRGR
jgi:hypothetical protein